MPVTGYESNKSRGGSLEEGRSDSVYWKLKYVVSGSDDPQEISSWIDANVPSSYMGGLRGKAEYEEEGDGTTWFVTVRYSPFGVSDAGGGGEDVGTQPPRKPTQGEARFRVTIGSHEEKVTTGIKGHRPRRWEEFNDYKDKSFNPNFIGYDPQKPDEEIAGVDVIVPNFEFAFDFSVPPSLLSREYFNTCADLVGTVNDRKFFGFDEGTCLLKNVTGAGLLYAVDATQLNDYCDLTFEFGYRPNFGPLGLDDLWAGENLWHVVSDPGERTGFQYYGWNHIETYEKKVLDEDSKLLTKKLLQINVWQIYPYRNFNDLAIPGTLPETDPDVALLSDDFIPDTGEW